MRSAPNVPASAEYNASSAIHPLYRAGDRTSRASAKMASASHRTIYGKGSNEPETAVAAAFSVAGTPDCTSWR